MDDYVRGQSNKDGGSDQGGWMLCVVRKVRMQGESRGRVRLHDKTKKQALKISRPRGAQESLNQKAPKDQEDLSQKEAQCQGSRGSRLLTRIDREAGNLAVVGECWKWSCHSRHSLPGRRPSCQDW